ncbi:hypothetical protein JCGZ_17187 [Jatropha curcas]|uniref:Serpin domain-containing protein n=1 Tax=Jatropha curcas TaxID=180498 RepID=A0A067LLE7_JATCU|nr:hypothetical protein JCGZ_17187 [Jatropha curcas]
MADSCTVPMESDPTPMEIDINNRLAFGMRIAKHMILQEINNGSKQNLVLSPLSLHVLLNLLASGSEGRTLEQMLNFLESESINDLTTQSSQMMDLAKITEEEFPESEVNISNLNSQEGSSNILFGDGRPYAVLVRLACMVRMIGHQPKNFVSQNSVCMVGQQPKKVRQCSFSSSPLPSTNGNARSTGRNDEGPIISFVNGIWTDSRFPIKLSFKQLAEDVYKAKAETVDLMSQAEKVRCEVNLWAEKATKGLIKDILPPGVLDGTIFVLANALYFKGTWLNPFKASNTEDEDFHLLNGKAVRVPFMKGYSIKPQFYGIFEGFKILMLPYKKGKNNNKQFSMYIFLPDKKDGLKELVQRFNFESRLLHEQLELQQVELSKMWIPKLKFSYEFSNVHQVMQELGLTLPFYELNEELTGIVDSEYLYVSKAIQKYIEVNEEGTVAIAFTVMNFCCQSSMTPAPPQPSFVADHPFMFMIKEEVSGIVLFTGAVLNPLI